MANGQKVGVWEYFGPTTTGEQAVVQRYDHNTNKLIYFRPAPYSSYLTEVKPNEWRYVQPDQPPLFIGGNEALKVYASQLVYPPEAQSKLQQGKVVVTFVIDTLGHTSNYKVKQRVGRACDEEALRVAHLVPQTWVPARMGSHAVAVEYELPFTFRMAGR